MNGKSVAQWMAVATVTVLWALNPSVVEAAEQKVVEASFEPGQISFKPVVSNEGLTLTVTGPDHFRFFRAFEKGETPTIAAAHEDGSRLADGRYTYEIRVTPALDDEARKHLVKARLQGNNSAFEELRSRGALSSQPLVQSGWITVHNGAFVTPSESETANKDIVHLDDVIIDGSQCVGNDCYSGLAFGFDTIVLMENNLRIFFDDTSTIQNYPRNDWRIIANDSTDGGGKYFAIEDATDVSKIFVLEAGAPDNSLYVDSHGDVGINTSTPYYELHIVDGDSPAVRLEQDSSYGWPPQKWDLAGNESNFFIRDATHASKLPFRIEPEAPTDSIFIKSNGNVGIGTGSPDADVDIESNSGAGFRLTNTGSGGGTWDIFMNANTSRLNVEFNDGNIPLKIDDGANNNLLQLGIGAANRVDINGNLVVSGTITPDYVFEPGYQLESIEEHAEYMWTNKHLPAVGAATLRSDGSHAVDLGARSQSMLEELEKAHIYIDQLNDTIEELRSELAKQDEDHERRLAELEAISAQQPR